MADALRRPEFGYVSSRVRAIEIRDFRRASVAALSTHPPDAVIVFDATWDPLHLLDRGASRWLLTKYYGYEPAMTPDEIARALSMRVARRWESGGQKMALLERAYTTSRRVPAVASNSSGSRLAPQLSQKLQGPV